MARWWADKPGVLLSARTGGSGGSGGALLQPFCAARVPRSESAGALGVVGRQGRRACSLFCRRNPTGMPSGSPPLGAEPDTTWTAARKCPPVCTRGRMISHIVRDVAGGLPEGILVGFRRQNSEHARRASLPAARSAEAGTALGTLAAQKGCKRAPPGRRKPPVRAETNTAGLSAHQRATRAQPHSSFPAGSFQKPARTPSC